MMENGSAATLEEPPALGSCSSRIGKRIEIEIIG